LADIIRFSRSAPLRPTGNARWRRFPRFDEVGAQIDVQAARLLDPGMSLERQRELYARVEQRLRPEDRELLRELYEAITRHHERYEHAAYVVGLHAGSGQLQGMPTELDDDRSPDDDEPRRA
jgi:hypothetical protein